MSGQDTSGSSISTANLDQGQKTDKRGFARSLSLFSRSPSSKKDGVRSATINLKTLKKATSKWKKEFSELQSQYRTITSSPNRKESVEDDYFADKDELDSKYKRRSVAVVSEKEFFKSQSSPKSTNSSPTSKNRTERVSSCDSFATIEPDSGSSTEVEEPLTPITPTTEPDSLSNPNSGSSSLQNSDLLGSEDSTKVRNSSGSNNSFILSSSTLRTLTKKLSNAKLDSSPVTSPRSTLSPRDLSVRNSRSNSLSTTDFDLEASDDDSEDDTVLIKLADSSAKGFLEYLDDEVDTPSSIKDVVPEKDVGVEPEQFHQEELLKFTTDGKILILGGTVRQLVNRLVSTKTVDPDYIKDFLLTYRYFVSSDELLKLFIERYRFEAPAGSSPDVVAFFHKWRSPIRLRVINILRKWMEYNWWDFHHDLNLIAKFTDFVKNEVANSDLNKWADTLMNCLHQDRLQYNKHQFSTEPPKPVLPKYLNSLQSLKNIPPKELARQLTLYEWSMFEKITPVQLRSSLWNKPNKEQTSPDVVAMTTWFNKFSYWIASDIVKPDIKYRIKILCFWIQVAEECKKLHNFNTLMEILAALGLTCVTRLKRTWKELPEKFQLRYSNLESLMHTFQNYKNYRQVLQSVSLPVFPYLGLFLRDLLFTEEGNADHLENGMVNFMKMRMVAKTICLVQHYQAHPYNLKEVKEILDFIRTGPLNPDEILDEDTLYQHSTMYEPLLRPLSVNFDRTRRSFGSTMNTIPHLKHASTAIELKLSIRPSVQELKERNILKLEENNNSGHRGSIAETLSEMLNARPTPDQLIQQGILPPSESQEMDL